MASPYIRLFKYHLRLASTDDAMSVAPTAVMKSAVDLMADGTVKMSTLQSHVKRILRVKYDLGLFDNPYIPDSIDAQTLTVAHAPLTHHGIVLLENCDNTLPLDPAAQNIRIIALIGPFSDMFSYGDYSGQWGAYPVSNTFSTIHQAMFVHLNGSSSSGQYNIPGYLLLFDGVPGMRGTYYTDTNFTEPIFTVQETPNRNWGLYPPVGLPSNKISIPYSHERLSRRRVARCRGWAELLCTPVCGRPVDLRNECFYQQASAVINAVIHLLQLIILQFFPGQSGGQAISDVLFGLFDPGGRVPLSVPYNVGILPVYYKWVIFPPYFIGVLTDNKQVTKRLPT
ncbi:hypothetical protein DFH07DRAFT_766060 [Mycena maculata]|uniref:beta-glucosidase n=1 Tax=Mycena maculata TaxID=230809 RepID=A0AAD7K3V6_9AGAR|nr:hypothetical protein DFH07DRAFT_766060 [Mycena maculata]